eukprot:TRINITY_DN24417_c0_g1_i1.p2 TRINITY_DN24417_c0_g1~~TRINITY_DN24417_c0_g1_i1.p2  ORF type:complete len:115 (+),score=7.85 TRINITY_DN24417_c0_g1_i1:209-553(+)
MYQERSNALAIQLLGLYIRILQKNAGGVDSSSQAVNVGLLKNESQLCLSFIYVQESYQRQHAQHCKIEDEKRGGHSDGDDLRQASQVRLLQIPEYKMLLYFGAAYTRIFRVFFM